MGIGDVDYETCATGKTDDGKSNENASSITAPLANIS